MSQKPQKKGVPGGSEKKINILLPAGGSITSKTCQVSKSEAVYWTELGPTGHPVSASNSGPTISPPPSPYPQESVY